MTDYQSNETLTGRIIALKTITAQCANEIKQLEGVLKGREGKPPVPSIPADCIPYDPDVPLPKMAEEIEMYWKSGEHDRYPANYKFFQCRNLFAYRVTKWKLPEGFKPHMGGERPADAVGSGKVVFADGLVVHNTNIAVYRWLNAKPTQPWNVIGYLPDAKGSDLDTVIGRIVDEASASSLMSLDTEEVEKFKNLARQFAAAIVAGKKGE